MAQIEVGILGATGAVGQQFIALLEKHPWFKVTWLGASERSAGKAFRDAAAWRLPNPLPEDVARQKVENATAAPGNARNYRMEADVPLLIPEVNGDHLALLKQQEARGWRGRIVTNPNCVVVVYAMALAPLRQFGLKTSIITTLQAISGAGYPGVPSWDILGNVVPFIDGEEHKIETETKKILGCLTDKRVTPHSVTISASTTRVAVQDGHTESISVGFEHRPAAEAIIEAFNTFKG